MGLGNLRLIGREKGALMQLGTVVARLWVCDHFTRIPTCAQATPDEFVETELLWPRHFNDAVHWRSHRDLANRTGDILSRHGLDQNGCESHHVAVGCGVSDALDELEELCRVHDRVGIDDPWIRFSWAILARKWPLSERRSVPTTDNAT